MKRYRTILVLAGVLLILGGIATWDEHKTKQEKAEEEAKNKLLDFKVEDVTSFSFESKGTTEGEDKSDPVSLTASKVDGRWMLTSPVQQAADGGAIENLLKTIKDFNYTKVVAESRDKWKEFGLEQPARTVSFTFGTGKDDIYHLHVGNKAPVGFSVYLRDGKSDKVYIGGQHLLMATSKSLHEFRDKTIASIDEKALQSLVYERAGQAPIELKREGGTWAIEKPTKLEADAAEIRDMIDEVNLAKAVAFEDKPGEAMQKAFATPALALTWTATDGKATTLKFGEVDGRLYASSDPAKGAAALPEEAKGKLEKDLTAFRNRRILKIDSTDLSQLDINGDSYKVVEGSWYKADEAAKLLGPEGKPKTDVKDKPAEVAHLRAFVVDLEFARTDSFLGPEDPAVKGLTAAPAHRVTLTFKDPAKQPPVTLDLFPAPGADDKYLVKVSGAETVYRVNKSVFNSMTPPKPGEPASPPAGEGVLPGMEEDPGAALDDPDLGLDEDEAETPPVAKSDDKSNNG